MRYFLWSLSLVVLWSCNSKETSEKEVTIVDGTKTYDVYQPSEMSNLMKGMYAFNEQVKKDIVEGKEVSADFPEEFLKIHSAQLSETKLRNQTFEHFSARYLAAQKLVFIEDTVISVKKRHNNAINMCIACHKSECTGPIPKIKKLLIN